MKTESWLVLDNRANDAANVEGTKPNMSLRQVFFSSSKTKINTTAIYKVVEIKIGQYTPKAMKYYNNETVLRIFSMVVSFPKSSTARVY